MNFFTLLLFASISPCNLIVCCQWSLISFHQIFSTKRDWDNQARDFTFHSFDLVLGALHTSLIYLQSNPRSNMISSKYFPQEIMRYPKSHTLMQELGYVEFNFALIWSHTFPPCCIRVCGISPLHWFDHTP
jgi:hypothetical protein